MKSYISQQEFEVYQKLQQNETSKSIKMAYREGLFKGARMSGVTVQQAEEAWNDSHSRQDLLDNDITLPL